jgi:hypothetical protein
VPPACHPSCAAGTPLPIDVSCGAGVHGVCVVRARPRNCVPRVAQGLVWGIHVRGIEPAEKRTDLAIREGGGRRGTRRIDKGGYMKMILKGLALATIVLALTAQGNAAGPVTTSDFFVGPKTDEPGLSSGLVLTNGPRVTVTATGVVCASFNNLCVSPDGNPSADTTQSSFGGFVLPGAPAWGLIGRVGSGPWVQVGSGPNRLSGTGELVFAVNDDLFSDNTGGFMVTVSYKEAGVTRTCWPGWGHGDVNHEHCGPPGQANKPPPPGQSSEPTQGSSNEHGKSEEKGTPKK